MIEKRQISDFYDFIRDYWAQLGQYKASDRSFMLNFGYWPPGVNNLGDAQRCFVDQVLENLRLPEGVAANGLEIGCGVGGVSIHMLRQMPTLHMTGLDIAVEQIERARENAQTMGVGDRFSALHGSSMAIPVADGAYDLTACIESSFHYEEKEAFFAENFRVLKPGGRSIVADITCANHHGLLFKKDHYFESVDKYMSIAHAVGFSVERVQDIGARVYAPLYDHIVEFNKLNRSKAGRYWAQMLHNYQKMSADGQLSYHIFSLHKPA